jgi:hypothetical protein
MPQKTYKNKLLLLLIIVVLFVDLAYSFRQYLANPLDWDMAGGIIPAENVMPVLNHPLGLYAIYENVDYPNPNRFFSHWSIYQYFSKMPVFLQNFMSPVDSVYWSGAIAKIILHIGFLIVLMILFTGDKRIFTKKSLIAMLLITPLFQVYGYQNHMGIIEKSNTYLFFYTLPMLLLLIYFTPFILRTYYKTELKLFWYHRIIFIILAFVISLSGPLNPGIILIFSSLSFLHLLFTHLKLQPKNQVFQNFKTFFKNIPPDYLFFLIPASLLSVYSLYLGSHNNVNSLYQMPIVDIYKLLPKGFFLQFFQKPGFPIIFSIIAINFFFLKKYKSELSSNLFKSYLWVLIFCLLYILLLPIGGYRDYRPFVLRYDTILPVTIAIFYIYISGSISIANILRGKMKTIYISVIILVAIAFLNADRPNFKDNLCEKEALNLIAATSSDSISLNCDCKVIAWNKQTSFKENTQNSVLLYKWGITKKLTAFSNN